MDAMPLGRAAIAAMLVAATSGGVDAWPARAAATPAQGTHGSTALSWSVSEHPFALSFSSGGETLTSEATSPGSSGRLGYALTDGTVHAVTDLVSSTAVPGGTRYVAATDEARRQAIVTVTRRANSRGLDVRFALRPAQAVAAVSEAFTAGPGEQYLGGGENRGSVDLRGHAAAEFVSYTCGSEFPMPFFLSSRGYGIFVRDLGVGAIVFPGGTSPRSCGVSPECPLSPASDAVDLCFHDPALHYDVYAGSFADVEQDFTADAGRVPRADPAEFGGQKWRGVWNQNRASTLLADAAEYRKLRIPLTWMHINDPWEPNHCWGTQTFDPARFPHPAALVHALHADGLRTMIWVSPLVLLARNCPRPAFSHLLGAQPAPMIDLTDPAQWKQFVLRLEKVFAIGIDGIKGDRGDEADLEDDRPFQGPGTTVQNRYPVLYARAVMAALRATAKHGFAAIFRAGAVGSQSLLPGIDVGDEPGTYAGMMTAICAGLTASVSGTAVWGSDIGGYSNETPDLTPELFVRWAQLSSVTPVFEVGGLGMSAHFWDWGPSLTANFRDAATLHYELVPYLLDLSRAASATGLPITRPLAFDYPDDPSAWNAEFEFTVGSSLLAAPVVGSGVTPSVYLPEGPWVDLYSGRVVRGPVAFIRPTPDAQFPLYLRAGSAIPFNLREPDVWSSPWGLSDLIRAGRAGWLVAPGASGNDSSTTAGDVQFAQEGDRFSIAVTGAPRQLQVLVLTRSRPAEVSVDGVSTPPVPAASLRGDASGWTFRPGPFAGVLVKATTADGSARVELDTSGVGLSGT